jgi:hypothetical protein
MTDKVNGFFVSMFYVNTQSGGFSFANCVVDLTTSKLTSETIESLTDYFKAKYKNSVVILNVIPLEEEQ